MMNMRLGNDVGAEIIDDFGGDVDQWAAANWPRDGFDTVEELVAAGKRQVEETRETDDDEFYGTVEYLGPDYLQGTTGREDRDVVAAELEKLIDDFFWSVWTDGDTIELSFLGWGAAGGVQVVRSSDGWTVGEIRHL